MKSHAFVMEFFVIFCVIIVQSQLSNNIKLPDGTNIISLPINKTISEGDKVRFKCEAESNTGKIFIKWYKNGEYIKEIRENSTDSRIIVSENESLTIDPVNMDDDGKYVCEITSGIHRKRVAAYLNVEYPAKIIYTPSVKYLPLGESALIPCVVKANPPLDFIVWHRDKYVLEPSQTSNFEFLNNGSLLFRKVLSNYGGTYKCIAYNKHGSDGASDPIEVIVREPELIATDEATTEFQIKTTSDSSFPDEAFYLPAPTVLKPGLPRNLTISNTKDGVVISWEAPSENSHLIKYYTIQYRIIDDWRILNKNRILPGDILSHTVRNLVGGRKYCIRVVANSESTYAESEEVSIVMPTRVTHVN